MDGITSPPMSSSGSMFNPLLISMLGILVTSLALIFYHFFLVKYFMRRHQSTTVTAAHPTPPQYLPTGVGKKLLDTIPISPFSALKAPNSHAGPHECAVCLGELEEEDVVRLLPNCKHAFHLPCIDQWLLAHASCPLCRSPIAPLKLPKSSSRINSDRENNMSGIGNFHITASSSWPAAAERRQSLTLDLSVVVVDPQSESEIAGNSSGELRASGSQSARSLSRFDRMSSRLLRAFTRLRLGRTNSSRILPY